MSFIMRSRVLYRKFTPKELCSAFLKSIFSYNMHYMCPVRILLFFANPTNMHQIEAFVKNLLYPRDSV